MFVAKISYSNWSNRLVYCSYHDFFGDSAQRNAEVPGSRSRDAALDSERCRGRGRGVARNFK